MKSPDSLTEPTTIITSVKPHALAHIWTIPKINTFTFCQNSRKNTVDQVPTFSDVILVHQPHYKNNTLTHHHQIESHFHTKADIRNQSVSAPLLLRPPLDPNNFADSSSFTHTNPEPNGMKVNFNTITTKLYSLNQPHTASMMTQQLNSQFPSNSAKIPMNSYQQTAQHHTVSAVPVNKSVKKLLMA